MSDFLDSITQFPTVIFTVLLVVSFGFWLVSTILGFGLDTLDLDADVDGEAGGIGAFLGIFGLAAAPIVFTLSLSSLFGWLISAALVELLGDRSTWAALSFGFLILIAAFLAGLYIAGLVAKPLAPLFVSEPAQKRADFIGRTCIVRTEKVTDEFGQAEVRDAEGTDLLVQVRAPVPNDFVHGSEAIIFSLDDEAEVYRITADPDLT